LLGVTAAEPVLAGAPWPKAGAGTPVRAGVVSVPARAPGCPCPRPSGHAVRPRAPGHHRLPPDRAPSPRPIRAGGRWDQYGTGAEGGDKMGVNFG